MIAEKKRGKTKHYQSHLFISKRVKKEISLEEALNESLDASKVTLSRQGGDSHDVETRTSFPTIIQIDGSNDPLKIDISPLKEGNLEKNDITTEEKIVENSTTMEGITTIQKDDIHSPKLEDTFIVPTNEEASSFNSTLSLLHSNKQLLWNDIMSACHKSHTDLYDHNHEAIEAFFNWLQEWDIKIRKANKFVQNNSTVKDPFASSQIPVTKPLSSKGKQKKTSPGSSQTKLSQKLEKGQKTLFGMFKKKMSPSNNENKESIGINENNEMKMSNTTVTSKPNDQITNLNLEVTVLPTTDTTTVKLNLGNKVDIITEFNINKTGKYNADHKTSTESCSKVESTTSLKRKRESKLPMSRKKLKCEEDEDFIDFGTNSRHSSLSPLNILTGPVGSGKSHCIITVAKELGFSIMEFNNAQNLTKNFVLQNVLEATQSHTLGSNHSKTLLLFEHVDLIDINGIDQGFFTAINQLLEHTKRPIVFTCNSLNFVDQIQRLNLKNDILHFRKYNTIENISTSINEKLSTNAQSLQSLCHSMDGDTRKIINFLQYWSRHQGEFTLEGLCEKYIGAEIFPISKYKANDVYTVLKESLQNVSHLKPIYHTYMCAITKDTIENNQLMLDCIAELDILQQQRQSMYSTAYSKEDISLPETALCVELLQRLLEIDTAIQDTSPAVTTHSNDINSSISSIRSNNSNSFKEHTTVNESSTKDSIRLSQYCIQSVPFYNAQKSIQRCSIQFARNVTRMGYSPTFEEIDTISTICFHENERKQRENKRRFYHHFQTNLTQEQIHHFTRLGQSNYGHDEKNENAENNNIQL